jgi:membrane-associated phospholipid phosphatase
MKLRLPTIKFLHKTKEMAFLVILFYVTLLNISVIRSSPEIIVLQYLVLIFIFKKAKFKNFTELWVPFIAAIMFYEFVRGYVDDLSPTRHITLYWIYNLESKILGTLPVIYFRSLPQSLHFTIINIFLFFYGMFFYYPLLIGLFVWLKSPDMFKDFAKRFLLVTYIGLFFYTLMPTAPPWLIPEIAGQGIQRYLYSHTILNGSVKVSILEYFIYGNAVAAFPSLHVAWPFFSSIFLIKSFKNKYLYLTLAIPILIGVSVVITGEHYIIDILAGWLLAFVVVNFDFNKIRFRFFSLQSQIDRQKLSAKN